MTYGTLKEHSTSKKIVRRSYLAEAVSAALFATVVSAPVYAAEDKDGSEVIIVTATKTAESLQTVPLAVTALTGEFIEEVHLVDVMDLVNYSPGVNGGSQNSFLDSINVRGVRTEDYGSGGDPSLGFFKNDQYEGRSGSAISTLFDMDRAEIVNGPQGFLFGRNAIGGAISVHTRQAELDYYESSVDIDIGENNLFKLNATVNFPINENIAMRFAIVSHDEDSHMTNINPDDQPSDTDVKAIRWSTTYAKDDLKITTMAEYEDRTYPAGLYRFIEKGELWEGYDAIWDGNRGDELNIDTNSHWGLRDEAEVLNLQLKLEKEFDFADLTINAGYKDHNYLYAEQWLPSPAPAYNGSWAVDQEGQYSQLEIRLNSNGDGPLSWYAGASLYNEDLRNHTLNMMSDQWMCDYYSAYYGLDRTNTDTCQNFHDNFNDYYGSTYLAESYYPNILNNPDSDLVHEYSHANGEYSGWATYLNLDYQLTDTINLEFGVRHTQDDKTYKNIQFTNGYSMPANWNIGGTTAEQISTSKSWSDTSYKYLARWQATDDMMLYASYTEGYKSGGFDSHDFEGRDGAELDSVYDLTNANAQSVSFDPEFVESYELGYKDTWFDDTDVRFTFYSYDYRGLQISRRLEGGQTVISNLGNNEANGIEASTNTALGEYFTLMLNFNIIDSKVFGVDAGDCGGVEGGCEGNKIPWTPENSGALVLDGSFPLSNGSSITTSIETYWEDARDGGFTFDDVWRVPASQTWSARIGYEPDANWYVEAYVDNLTDERNFDSSYDGGASYPATHWAVWKPRTFGIRMGMNWE
ncbi:MAG: TonB-dependent receptor [Gammaproteobacteria bacterium]|nr:TonB-dependent receptor [Gammaproteobacteria bacterium]